MVAAMLGGEILVLMEEEFNGRLSLLTGEDQSDEMYDLTSCVIIDIVACLFTVVHSDSCFDFAAVREDVERWMDETREAREVGHSAAKAEGGERRTSESFDFELRDSRLLSPSLHHPPPSCPTFSATLTSLRSTDCDHNYLLQKSQDQNPTFSLAGESERRRLQRSAQIEK